MYYWKKNYSIFGKICIICGRWFLQPKTPPNRMFWLKKNTGLKIFFFFLEIWRIQIQIYPQTPIEPKYGAFYLKNKVGVPFQSLLVQLRWRVTPPYRAGIFSGNLDHSLILGHSWMKESCKIDGKYVCSRVTVIEQPPELLRRFLKGAILKIMGITIFSYKRLCQIKCQC